MWNEVLHIIFISKFEWVRKFSEMKIIIIIAIIVVEIIVVAIFDSKAVYTVIV